VVYFRVVDPVKAVVEIEDYYFATSQLAQTTLRSVIGQSELDELLIEREQINSVVRDIIDKGTDPWGIEVTSVEVKDIDLPQEMKRAMAKQAEAERERRGKVIAAAGEAQAAAKLAEAAETIQDFPVAIQLRYLQTVVEIAAENNSTTIFPVPMDLFKPFLDAGAALKTSKDPESLSLSSGTERAELTSDVDQSLLTDAAKAVLGIGSGPSGAPSGAEQASQDKGTEEPATGE
jgi:regulator of protease activity HflC (stomatin/prohibitin superfamily)